MRPDKAQHAGVIHVTSSQHRQAVSPRSTRSADSPTKRSTRGQEQVRHSKSLDALDRIFGIYDVLAEEEHQQRRVDHLLHLRRRLEQLLIDTDFGAESIEVLIRDQQLLIAVSGRAADDLVDLLERRTCRSGVSGGRSW